MSSSYRWGPNAASTTGSAWIEATLNDAMRLGSHNPAERRDPADLRRFGLGLKHGLVVPGFGLCYHLLRSAYLDIARLISMLDRAAPDAADARSEHARVRHGEGAARRRGSARRRRRKLHHRPDAQPRAGDDGAGRRAAGHGLQLHDELGRQQDLSGHRARRRHVRHARSDRSREADRDDQPSGSLHAPRRRLRAEAIRPRHGRAVHRRRRRARSAAVHGARQPDRAEARARR